MKNLFFTFLLLYSGSLFAQNAFEAEVLGNWTDPSVPTQTFYNNPYNETWGFEHEGREYAVIGSTLGMHIFDVSDDSIGQEYYVPGAHQGTSIIHRDMKTYNGYLYCVADEGSGSTLQIIDCTTLPDSVSEVYSSNEFVTRSHNVFIDTAEARLYLLGNGSRTKVLDISNPMAPVQIGNFPNNVVNFPYTHDGYIKNNIAYLNCGQNQGLWILDFTNIDTPTVVGKFQNYTGIGYNHSGWLGDDGNTYYMLDETHGSPIKAVDVSDPTDMKELSTFDAESTPNQIAHNAIVRGDYLYVSYYYDGLQVFNIADPSNPYRVAHYPTSSIVNNNSYQGAWGVYVFKTSGRILISDMQTGLWFFEDVAKTVSQKEAAQRPLGIYPNPIRTAQTINVILGDVQGDVLAELYDLQGKLVMNKTVQGGLGTFQVEMPSVAAGQYVLTMRQNGRVWVEQIVVH